MQQYFCDAWHTNVTAKSNLGGIFAHDISTSTDISQHSEVHRQPTHPQHARGRRHSHHLPRVYIVGLPGPPHPILGTCDTPARPRGSREVWPLPLPFLSLACNFTAPRRVVAPGQATGVSNEAQLGRTREVFLDKRTCLTCSPLPSSLVSSSLVFLHFSVVSSCLFPPTPHGILLRAAAADLIVLRKPVSERAWGV